MIEKCWICKNYADSNEHKFKASMIKKIYGKQFSVPMIYRSGNEEKILQGPNSKLLKFSRNICQNCNNELTQEHDKAFDNLITNILNQYDRIINVEPFFVEHFYNENWQINYINLFKYFAKIIGCRLNENGFSSKIERLSKFINGDIENTFISLKFEVKEGTKLYLQSTKTNEFNQTIFNGETCHFINDENKEYFHGWTSINWFTIHWLYSVDSKFDKKKLYSQKNYVKLIPFNIDEKVKSQNLLDWFEYSHINTEKLRKRFILDLIKEYQ